MKERTVKSCWHRILAVLLAISMVLIPVHFPGHVHAENVTLEKHPALFKDAFADSNKVNGVTYKWNMSHPTWTRADGVLTENTNGSGSYNRWALVSATTADGATDLAAAWQDYTVETKFTKKIYSWTEYDKDDNPVEKSNVHTVKLMANVQEDARFFYVLEITGKATDTTGTLALRKAWLDETYKKNGVATPTVVETLLASKGDNVMTPGTQHTMALKVENVMLEGDKPGVKLTAIYDGAEIFTVTDSADFEHSVTGQTGENSVKLDTEKKKCSVLYTAGTAGLRVAPQQGITQFDDFNVTSNDGAVLFADDFSDDRYIDGATAKWEIAAANSYDVTYNWSHHSTSGKLKIEDDRLIVDSFDSKSVLMLSGSMPDPENAGKTIDPMMNWKDYSLEVDMTRLFMDNPTEEGGDPVTAGGNCFIGFNLQSSDGINYTGNVIQLHPGSIQYGTITINKNGTGNGVMSFAPNPSNNGGYTVVAGGGAAAGVIRKIKIDVSGKDLTVRVFNGEGEQIGATFTKKNYLTHIGGNVGLLTDRPGSGATYSKGAAYDNLKVTLADGTEAFYEDFDISDFDLTDDTVAQNYLTEEKTVGDISYSWSRNEWGTSSSRQHTHSIVDGVLNINTNHDKLHSHWYLNCTADGEDIDKNWSNYTVRVDIKTDRAYADDNGDPQTYAHWAPGIVGRVTPVYDENGENVIGYTYYEVRLRDDRVYIVKALFDGETVTRSGNTEFKIGGAPASEKRTLEAIFTENSIKVNVYDADGALLNPEKTDANRTYVDEENVLQTGGVGLAFIGATKSEPWSAQYDNFEVELTDGSFAFTEDFDVSGSKAATSAYLAEAKLFEDAFRANVSNDWTINTDGAYGSTGTDASFSYVTMKSSDADLAQAWTDYIVKADMSLDATDGVGSLIARYSDAGYYEMRVNANGTVGLYRSGVAEALATGTFNETVANAQLEVCGTKLIGSINGTKVVERDTAEDDVKLTAGTAGVTSGNKVAYDNFSVTTHDWAAELTNDGTNHYYTCSGCESRKDEAACSGGSATCKDKAICDYCKKAYGDVAEHKFVDYVSDGNATYNNDGTKSAFCEYGCGEKDTIADEGSMKTGAVAQVGETKYGTLADALAAGDEIKLITDVTETEFVNATGKTIDLNGFTLTADILATIKVNGGTFKTSKYTMVSGTAGYYISTDAVFTISGANLDTTVHSGTLTLGNPDGWTNAGQKLVIEEDATFKIPANYKLNVQSTVTVEGTVVVDGTVILYNKDATIEVADNSLNVVVNPSAGDTVLYEGGKYIVHSHTGGTADCKNKAICGTCGQPYGDLSTEHKWSDTYTSENDQHWKECTVDGCAATTTKTNCTGGDAKCNAKAICEYCNQPYGNYDEDDHAAEAEWVKTPATHEMKYYNCCGATVTAEVGHSWVNGKCSVCEYECQHPLGTDATCIAKAVCDECGMQYGDLDPDNHGDQGPVWDRTATTHKLWYKNCCEAIEVTEATHEWENGMCTECTMICEHTGGTANCQSGKVCEICEMEYTEKNTTVHTVEAKWFKTEETHIKLHTCCNTIVVEEAEHTLVHGVCSVCQYCCTHTGGEATCNKKAVCTTCGEEYGNVDLTKHTKGAVWTKTADKHSKAYECCGTVVVAEAAHSGGTATCKDKAICSVCGEAYGELVAHKGGTATCKDKAKCTVCGESYGELAEHKGGEATCIEKAQCSVCGKQYGELNAAKHDGEAKWTKTADKHTKTYDCCGEVVVAEEAHKLTDGKCECGYEAPAPVEPGEIENATDADKNACGGTLDVKDEHLSDKLLTEEEKEAVKGGADIEISLKIEDISDKVSTADKAAVENKLGDMKVGMYLNIDLEKKVGDKAPVKITKTNGGVTVTITVPAELINTDAKIIRTYKVIRVHEGVADILDAIFDAKTGKLSFETDKFSTYTLVYSDAPSSDNSNTGDNTMIVLFGSLLALSALAAGVIMTPDIRKKLMGK